MPELANPLSLFGVILNEQRNSKSLTVPFQMRKVLPEIGFSAVVRPTMAPSRTDQSCVLPSHPVRSLPLKIGLNPASSAAGEEPACNNRMAPVSKPPAIFVFIFFPGLTWV